MNLIRLIDFAEYWATIYRPMLHEPGKNSKNKRFFCIESIANIANFIKVLPTTKSPFVAMETNLGADINERFFVPNYNIYFFVKTVDRKMLANDIRDAEAKEEAMMHAVAFRNYIKKEQERHEDDHMSPVQGIDLSNMHLETFGPIADRWFAVGISLFDLSKINNCVNPDDYTTSAREKQPCYYGPVNPDDTITENTLLTANCIMQPVRNATLAFTLKNQRAFYAYPQNMGALLEISDRGKANDYTEDFEMQTLNVNQQTYYVYVLTAPTTVKNFIFNFK